MLRTPRLLLFYSTQRCSGHLERRGPLRVLWGKLVFKAAVGMLAIWFPEQDGHRWRLQGFVLLSDTPLLCKEGIGTLGRERLQPDPSFINNK